MELLNGIVGKVTLGILRHFVTAFAGGLVTQGVVTKDQGDQTIGAIMVLITVGFSAYDKWKSHQAVIVAAQTGSVK